MKVPSRPPETFNLTWNKSARFRQISRLQCQRMNAEHRTRTRCGAKRRNGEPCQQRGMENGRCWIHGGATPRGDRWHQTKWPDPSAPDAEVKLARKLAKKERTAKRRAVRLARMSPDERAKHEAWHRAHRPGAASARHVIRQDVDNANWFRSVVARPEPEPSAEQRELGAQIAVLEQYIADIEGKTVTNAEPELIGVFK